MYDMEDRSDLYRIDYIKRYLDRPHFSINTLDLRLFSMMGDRVAVAVLKALYPEVRMDELLTRKVVAALNAAFEFPGAIDTDDDRCPAVTFCLLDAMLARAEAPDQRTQIQGTIAAIKGYVRRIETGP